MYHSYFFTFRHEKRTFKLNVLIVAIFLYLLGLWRQERGVHIKALSESSILVVKSVCIPALMTINQRVSEVIKVFI